MAKFGSLLAMRTESVTGPWALGPRGTQVYGTGDDQRLVAMCGAATAHPLSEQLANARLVAESPAMTIALEMIACGAARYEREGTLREFCFDGLRYSVRDNWNALFDLIGWDKALAAIAKAKGQ
jgi:hypothetical protein